MTPVEIDTFYEACLAAMPGDGLLKDRQYLLGLDPRQRVVFMVMDFVSLAGGSGVLDYCLQSGQNCDLLLSAFEEIGEHTLHERVMFCLSAPAVFEALSRYEWLHPILPPSPGSEVLEEYPEEEYQQVNEDLYSRLLGWVRA